MSARRRPVGGPLPYVPRPGAADPVDPSAPVTRDLRALYAAPEDPRYWDGLEARILAAVRGGAAATTGAVSGAVTGAFRVVPAAAVAAVEWWHALARWARPALAAVSVTLVIAGAALVGSRASADASRAHSAFRAVLGDPTDARGLPEPDPQLARAADPFDAEPDDSAGQADARAARIAAELLSDGLVRRHALPPADAAHRRGDPRDGDSARDARREATFRYVLPEP